MEWRADGTVLARRSHGESAVIIEVLTLEHGRHVGIVPGGRSRKLAALLQPGARLELHWRARQSDQLGHFRVQPLALRSSLLADPLGLAGLNAVCALTCFALPERDPHPALVAQTEALLDEMVTGGDWVIGYLQWEMRLLDEMGFGLDLKACAVTGLREGLAYVSPRTGRAVSREAAGIWASKLLPLPAILGGAGDNRGRGIEEGLAITGHFLETQLAAELAGRPLPAARARLVRLLGKTRR